MGDRGWWRGAALLCAVTVGCGGDDMGGTAAADSEGEPMGEVQLPSSVLNRQFELPLLWGVETDDFDVPYVVRYRVETSMIARCGPGTGATLAASRHVTPPRSQPSRGRRGGSSHDIAEAA